MPSQFSGKPTSAWWLPVSTSDRICDEGTRHAGSLCAPLGIAQDPLVGGQMSDHNLLSLSPTCHTNASPYKT